MTETLRAAFVIGRRDFVATVVSRTFFLFLLGPLLPILFGIVFAAVGAKVEAPPPERPVAVIAEPSEWQALLGAKRRLDAVLGADATPQLELIAPQGLPDRQARQILGRPKRPVQAVVTGAFAQPTLYASVQDDFERRRMRMLRLLIDDARSRTGALPPPDFATVRVAIPRPPSRDRSHEATARGGQTVLLVLTMILAGMLLSNLLEEKGSKVIEVLAAAVPTEAIFLGKLGAMLAMSLVGIAAWGSIAVAGYLLIAPAGLMPPAPAIGWPGFVALGLVYFAASYLLLGAVFLGIGAQASTVREVQTLSMPVTMSQLVVFGFASVAASAPASGLALAAAIFPLSSPLAMIALAAQSPAWWPHLLAILWQALWVAIIVRVAARRFRRSVLKSGGGRRGRKARPA